MIRRPPRSTLSSSSAASDVYKRQPSSIAVVPASISPATTNADRAVSSSPTFYTVHSMAPSVSRCLDSRSESASPRTNRVPLSSINPIQSYFPVIPQGDDAITPPTSTNRKKKDKKSPVVPVDFNPLSNLDFGRGGGLLAPKVGAPHAVSYTHLRAHETPEHLVCRLLLEKKKNRK
eukprot:TRINITY_DN46560_c0_g1_i1.p1 TRINITY_DN46560_c0_g1~~TRINITY_DN46560_c0_g1_i1.p1  ORF type:complete len:176 (-),score=46.23 TRINITY_DN46560_c0_g1_i1:87-614(-)